VSFWKPGFWKTGFWKPGFWAEDGNVTVPDLTSFSYADATLILTALGLLITGGPFLNPILSQSPVAGSLVSSGTTVTVTEEVVRVYGVDVGGMQPKDVVINGPPLPIQLAVDPQVTRLQLLQALEGLRNYIKTRKFPS
jgi:PASTA domain